MFTISESALVRRVNAQLNGCRLSVCSTASRGYTDLGRYNLRCSNTGAVLETHLDLRQLARELGVIGSLAVQVT